MPTSPNLKYRPPSPVDPPDRPADCDVAYTELAVTTNFSFLRGASHPDEMVYQSALLGHRAIAITDRNTLAGVVRAYEAARRCNLPLIIGARLDLLDAPETLVWVTHRAAYARLCRLLTLGKRRSKKGECKLSLDDLASHSQGLLAAPLLPPPSPSPVGSAPRTAFPPPPHPPALRLARDPLALLKDIFGPRLSLAVTAPYGPNDQHLLEDTARIARHYAIPLLATNDVHYHDPGRRPLQDILTCIRHGCTIDSAGFRLFPNAERCLKSPHQMLRLFRDHPRAIDRAMEIAAQCTFSLGELSYGYPNEFVPPGMTPTQYLASLTWSGAAERYPAGIPDKVRAQITDELTLIAQLAYEPYFLTIHDIVHFARSRGILCQGRGSAANSAVCYCLGITSVDPQNSQLLFARFLSAERGEPPDIDVDFEHERREEVIQYIYAKYGRDRAGMVASLITYRGRSAVRDVGKALGLSLDAVDQVAKRLDWWDKGRLSDQQVRDAGLDPADRTVQHLTKLSAELLGFPRHLSQHTGGMVMSHTPLCELVPIENAAMEDRTVIEWDKDDIDVLGLMKVDVLALGMLTCISKALSMINHSRAPADPLQLHSVPEDDPSVYDMICDADTIGVFQIESRAQMAMLPRLRPRSYYDIVIEVAIVRPGPIQGNMVHPYLRRRSGEEPVEYPSDELRAVLQRTLGVPLFQEQAMSIAIVAGGFTADEADRLRRAMAGWRKKGGIQLFRDKLINGMLRKGYQQDFAERCFAQIEGFGEYGFPESHAASFARLVCVSAWIKRHHPAIFCAALLNSQPMGFYAPAQIVRDAREHGVTVQPVDVNHSSWDCTLDPPTSDGRTPGPAKHTWGWAGPTVRLGFRQIRGMSQAQADRLVAARKQPFSSPEDAWRRSGVSSATMRLLADADAFSSMHLSRRQALWESLRLKDDSAPLFETHLTSEPTVSLPTMPLGQEVRMDYATARLSLKKHPVALVRKQLDRLKVLRAFDLPRPHHAHGNWVKVAGLVLIRQRPDTASGVIFQTLEDETGVSNLIVRPDIFDHFRPAARHAQFLLAEGRLQKLHNVVHVLVYRMTDLDPMLQGAWGRSRDFH